MTTQLNGWTACISFSWSRVDRSCFGQEEDWLCQQRILNKLPAAENPQADLENVKQGLRKIHNPVTENSIQP